MFTAADPRRELLQVKFEGVPVAWVRPFVSAAELAGDVVTGAAAVSLHQGRVWVRTTSPLTVKGLSVARAGRSWLPASDLRIEAELEHGKSATRIRVDALTLETAAGDRVEARGELNRESGAPAATSLRIDFNAVLPKLLATFVPVGAIQGRGALACTASGGVVRIDHLEMHVAAAADGRALMDLTSPAPFQWDRSRASVTIPAAGSDEVLRLAFGRLPLTLFQPWLGVGRLGGNFSPGELRAQVAEGGLRVTAVAPLRVEQFFAGGVGDEWVRDLTIELEPVVRVAAGSLKADLTAARVNTAAGAQLLSGRAEATLGSEGGGSGVRGTASFDLSVPALAGQPFLGGRLPPDRGRMSGEVRFTFNHDLLGEGRITLNGLVSPATSDPLPVANLSFRAGWSEQGSVAVQAPLLIDRSGERSDLTVAATLRPVDGGHQLDARISSQHFVFDDARMLVRAFTDGPLAPRGDQPTAEPPPTAAPWGAVRGEVALDLKSLVFDRRLEFTGLSGRIALDPRRLAADKITGRLGAEGQLQVGGEIRFAAGAESPFTAKYDLQVREFEIGPLFKAAAPGDAPTLEGRFNVRSQAEGTGRTLAELIAHTRGDYVVQSRKGILRALRRTPAAPRASGIVGGAARLIDNLGETVGNLVSYDEPTEEMAGQLTAFPYDQLNARLSRDAERNLMIADFSLVSPTVRLQGGGRVAYEPGKSLFERPLQMRLTMGVMGKAEATIARFKSPALAGERDELGFMKLREPFAVVGTLGRPDAGQLYAMLKPSLRERLLP
jgi:hypothetical protein